MALIINDISDIITYLKSNNFCIKIGNKNVSIGQKINSIVKHLMTITLQNTDIRFYAGSGYFNCNFNRTMTVGKLTYSQLDEYVKEYLQHLSYEDPYRLDKFGDTHTYWTISSLKSDSL